MPCSVLDSYYECVWLRDRQEHEVRRLTVPQDTIEQSWDVQYNRV